MLYGPIVAREFMNMDKSQLEKTTDGRYLIIDGKLWRATNPALPDEKRASLVRDLMSARRAVRDALLAKDDTAVRAARSKVHAAKVALGERGPVWWDDGAPDYNRMNIGNTPYRLD